MVVCAPRPLAPRGLSGADAAAGKALIRSAATTVGLRRVHLPDSQPQSPSAAAARLRQQATDAGAKRALDNDLASVDASVAGRQHSLGQQAAGSYAAMLIIASVGWLRDMRCDVGQGYLWSRPLPLGKLRELLASEPGPLSPGGSSAAPHTDQVAVRRHA